MGLKYNKMLKDQMGFSLVEAIIAFGLIGVASVVVTNLMTNTMKTQRGIQAKDQQREVTAKVRSLLSNSAACTQTFQFHNPTTDFSVVQIKDAAGNPVFTTGTKDSTGFLEFTRFSVTNWQPDATDPNEGMVDFKVHLSKTGQVAGPKEVIPDTITLKVKRGPTGNVSECFTVGSSAEDGFWTASPTQPGDIYYSGGKIGIGTTAPTKAIEVIQNHNGISGIRLVNAQPGGTGAAQFEAINDDGGMAFGVSGSGAPVWGAIDASDAYVVGHDDITIGSTNGVGAKIKFGLGAGVPHEQMRLTMTGLGIGVTNPTHKLQVAGNIVPDNNASRDLGAPGLRFKDVYATNPVIQSSDARLKKNIENSDLGLEFIKSLRPVSYSWKKSSDSKVHYGLIAQETEEQLKKFESVHQDGTKKVRDIVTHDKKVDAYGVRYTELIAPIIKAIQELYEEMMGNQTKIQEEVLALQRENAAMKTYLCAQDPKAPFCQP